MAAIGPGWATGAWIQASWATGAWAAVVAAGRSIVRNNPMIASVGRMMGR